MASPALLLLLFLSSSTSPLPTERPTGAEEPHHAPSHPDHILASFFKTFEPAAKSDPKPEPQLLELLGYDEGVEGEVARAQDRSDTTVGGEGLVPVPKAMARADPSGLWLAITGLITFLLTRKVALLGVVLGGAATLLVGLSVLAGEDNEVLQGRADAPSWYEALGAFLATMLQNVWGFEVATNQTSASIHPTNTSHHPAAGTFAGEVVENVTYPIADTVENTQESAAETAAEIDESVAGTVQTVMETVTNVSTTAGVDSTIGGTVTATVSESEAVAETTAGAIGAVAQAVTNVTGSNVQTVADMNETGAKTAAKDNEVVAETVAEVADTAATADAEGATAAAETVEAKSPAADL